MEKKYKLGVIGFGFMASAIVDGVISSKILYPSEIIVSDLSENSKEKAKKRGVNFTNDNFSLVNSSEFVLFAVKPQNLADVLDGIKGASCKKFISIMAGVKKAKIKQAFNDSCVARCMPNTPCAIGSGAVGIDVSDFTLDKDVEFVKNVFSSIAEVVFVGEEKLNAVTGVSGSAPAYFYAFIKAIVESGVKHGLEYDETKKLATATMIGAGKMVQNNSDKTLDELIKAVCSKGGTTIEAMNVFDRENLSKIVDEAISACVKRAGELENL